MSIYSQQIYENQMKAKGHKFAFYLQKWDGDVEYGDIVYGPFEVTNEIMDGLREKIRELYPDEKLIMNFCWINDEGEIVG